MNFLVYCFALATVFGICVATSLEEKHNFIAGAISKTAKFRKLQGDNIFHLNFTQGSKIDNLIACIEKTKKLEGKSFDFWLEGCYINADDTSTHHLKRSLRYQYYELNTFYEEKPNIEPPIEPPIEVPIDEDGSGVGCLLPSRRRSPECQKKYVFSSMSPITDMCADETFYNRYILPKAKGTSEEKKITFLRLLPKLAKEKATITTEEWESFYDTYFYENAVHIAFDTKKEIDAAENMAAKIEVVLTIVRKEVEDKVKNNFFRKHEDTILKECKCTLSYDDVLDLGNDYYTLPTKLMKNVNPIHIQRYLDHIGKQFKPSVEVFLILINDNVLAYNEDLYRKIMQLQHQGVAVIPNDLQTEMDYQLKRFPRVESDLIKSFQDARDKIEQYLLTKKFVTRFLQMYYDTVNKRVYYKLKEVTKEYFNPSEEEMPAPRSPPDQITFEELHEDHLAIILTQIESAVSYGIGLNSMEYARKLVTNIRDIYTAVRKRAKRENSPMPLNFGKNYKYFFACEKFEAGCAMGLLGNGQKDEYYERGFNEVFNKGNFREIMTLLFGGRAFKEFFADEMKRIKAEEAKNKNIPKYKLWLDKQSFNLNLDVMFERYNYEQSANLGPEKTPMLSESPIVAKCRGLPKDERRLCVDFKLAVKYSVPPEAIMFPKLGMYENFHQDESPWVPASSKKQTPLYVQTPPSWDENQLKCFFDKPDGSKVHPDDHFFSYNEEVQIPTEHGLPMLTGPSGTTDLNLRFASYLDFNNEEKLGLLGDIIGYLVPGLAHSFYEVLQGAQGHIRFVDDYVKRCIANKNPGSCVFDTIGGLFFVNDAYKIHSATRSTKNNLLSLKLNLCTEPSEVINCYKNIYNQVSYLLAQRRKERIQKAINQC